MSRAGFDLLVADDKTTWQRGTWIFINHEDTHKISISHEKTIAYINYHGSLRAIIHISSFFLCGVSFTWLNKIYIYIVVNDLIDFNITPIESIKCMDGVICNDSDTGGRAVRTWNDRKDSTSKYRLIRHQQ
jgi:hypothetical protein